jgi:hypothetical protein
MRPIQYVRSREKKAREKDEFLSIVGSELAINKIGVRR